MCPPPSVLSAVARPAAVPVILPDPRQARPVVNPVLAAAGSTGEPPQADSGRYRLWELDPGLLCSILGTCLDIEELRRIARKSGIDAPVELRDYEIHGYFVTHCARRSPLTKLVHKTLDRLYAGQIERFRAQRAPEEAWTLWQQCLTDGDVAGGYWAFMTLRSIPLPLQSRAHSEVHMLSHLMGRCSRDNLRRIRELERACEEQSARLQRLRDHNREALRERDERIRALEAQLAAAQARGTGPAPGARPAAPASKRAYERLQARFTALERRLKAERGRARLAERCLEEGSAARTGPAARGPAARSGPVAASVPAAAGVQADAESGTGAAAPDSLQSVNLNGRAVLYVGGHANVAPRLREQAQRFNASFIYHDGGLEAQNTQLPGLVSQADAVFCPIPCVSHDACLRLKHLCKRQGKCLVLLRSAGLTSFASALQAWAHGGGQVAING